MIELSNSPPQAQEHGRNFTAAAFGLMALASLVFAQLVGMFGGELGLTSEAIAVVGWSFVGLAALDALLLLTWTRFIDFITRAC